MPEYDVVWSIHLKKRVVANDEEDAKNIIENVDCQYDGSYISNSFEFVKVEKIK